MQQYQNQMRRTTPKIIIVEDDQSLLDLMDYHLRLEGYEVVAWREGEGVVAEIARSEPDLLLLDISLPGESGLVICRNVRRFSTVPIVFITAHSAEEEIVQGLAAGADDYITKPFRISEMLARVSAQLRRKIAYSEQAGDSLLHIGTLLINREQRRVFRDEEEIVLTSGEFRLLELFGTHADRVLNPEFLLHSIWGETSESANDLLRQTVRRLRLKIEYDSANPQFIVTRPGQGYLLLGSPKLE